MTGDYEIDQESARALVDAGYMPLAEYLELCKQNGWTSLVPAEQEKPKRQAISPPPRPASAPTRQCAPAGR
jgi:hypothetical protein